MKDKIQTVRQSDFFKSMRKEWIIRGLLRSALSPLMLTIVTGLLFWPLSILFSILTAIAIVKELLNIHCSLLALAEMDSKDFSELIFQHSEGRLEAAAVGSYAKEGLLFKNAFIPYNNIVKIKYCSPKPLREMIKDIIEDILFVSPWSFKTPCVIIYRNATIFGKKITLTSKHLLPGNINCAPILDKFTDEIVARSANKVLIDNDYYFYGL